MIAALVVGAALPGGVSPATGGQDPAGEGAFGQTASSITGVRTATGPLFAHASEAEMARILEFYAVRWEYEPHTFPILWNLEGDVVESFSPDFWLPELDLYLEITTLRQKLVRKKNRKLRRLRELYPDINIKLFYARDFRALMLKYGKLALAGSLSGTLGQVGPGGIVPGLAGPGAFGSRDLDPGPVQTAGQAGPSQGASAA